MSAAAFLEGLRRGHRLRRSRARRVAFCTIATEAFLPWALVLFDALARHHPHAARVLLYVRAGDEAHRVPRVEGVTVLAVEDLVDAATEATLRRRYGIAELCFALKPRLLRHCLDRFGERAVYLDSDLDVQGRLDQAMIELEGANVVLTPHLDAPLPYDGKRPSELTILRAGSFNAGFVAVSESPEARAFLEWWDTRAAHWGFVAPEWGYQGDQKWLDLAPLLFRGVAVLRDLGSNVGAWSLHVRRVERGPRGYTVNGSPLAFFHFSGFDPDEPGELSRYQNRVRMRDYPAVAELAADFARRIVAARPRATALSWTQRRAPAPGAVHAPALEGPMPSEAYRQGFAFDPPAGSFDTGEEIAITLRVINASPHAWPVAPRADGSGGIALSFHLYDADEKPVKWDNRRFPLPVDLGPGESVEVVLGVRAPDMPGLYHVEPDLVHEGVTWFSAQHGTMRFPVWVGRFERP